LPTNVVLLVYVGRVYPVKIATFLLL